MQAEVLNRIRQFGECVDSDTRLDASLVTTLKQENLFSKLLPTSLNGSQMDYPPYIKLVQQVAEADGSVGWCMNQGSVLASLARLLPGETAKRIYSSPNITLANGPPGHCESVKQKNGYSLSGRWTFSSGICHADWLIGMAPVRQNDEIVDYRWHFFRKELAEVVEDWPVNGLKATGSYAFTVKDLHIPASHAVKVEIREDDAPLYQIPLNLLFACGFAAVALGVSRAALDFALETLQLKVKRFDKQTANQYQLTQDQVGRAEAIWQAAEAFLHRTVETVWEKLISESTCSMDNRIKLRLAATHTIREASRATDLAYELCSTESIFAENSIQKRFQDMHVITQHLQGRPEVYSVVGKHYLGLDPDHHLIS